MSLFSQMRDSLVASFNARRLAAQQRALQKACAERASANADLIREDAQFHGLSARPTQTIVDRFAGSDDYPHPLSQEFGDDSEREDW